MNAKLLLISYDFPPSTGGIARLCLEIVSNIKNYYESVEVLTIGKENNFQSYDANLDIKITYLSRKRILSEFQAIQFLRKWKHKNQTDVICGTWHPDAALAILAGFKYVYILAHGTELLYGKNTFRKYFWLPIYAKWVLGRARRVIANSNYTQNLVRHINPMAKVEALPLGVNTEFFKPLNRNTTIDKLRICTVSRILQFKGHDFILNCLESLPLKYLNKIEWHIAGTGPFLDNLKQLVSNSNVKEKIYFHGFIPDIELPQFYNTCDLFILATRQEKKSKQVEGFGLVFLEAQSCGIPVIGTNTGGISDAIDDRNGGWLIEQDDRAALQKILIQLISNPKLIQIEGEKARQRVMTSANWKYYVKNLYKAINS